MAADMMPEVLAQSFRALQLEIRAGNLGERITDFSGDNSRRYHAWIRDLETTGLAAEATDSTMRALAVRSVRGHAAEFLSRVISESPQITWADLKQKMKAHFSDDGDREIALQKLRKLKQNKGESIQAFGERIRKIAVDAYPGQDLDNPVICDTLVGTLIEGTVSDRIATKLLRSKPDSFEAAMGMALREQQTSRLFELRRKEEAMEVDVVQQSPQNPSVEVLEGLVARLESIEKRAFQKPKSNKKQNFKPANRFTDDGRPICNFCNKVGHKWKECRSRLASGKDQTKTVTKN